MPDQLNSSWVEIRFGLYFNFFQNGFIGFPLTPIYFTAVIELEKNQSQSNFRGLRVAHLFRLIFLIASIYAHLYASSFEWKSDYRSSSCKKIFCWFYFDKFSWNFWNFFQLGKKLAVGNMTFFVTITIGYHEEHMSKKPERRILERLYVDDGVDFTRVTCLTVEPACFNWHFSNAFWMRVSAHTKETHTFQNNWTSVNTTLYLSLHLTHFFDLSTLRYPH